MNPVISKIQKLLALANDRAATESEAANAMQKAHAILAEHNLSMADINEQNTSADTVFDGHSSFEPGRQIWKPAVYSATAKLYFCHYFYSATYQQHNGEWKQGQKHTILGTENNAAVAKSMAEYFINVIETLAKQQTRGLGRSYADSFKKGCAVRLTERIMEQIKLAKEGKAKASDGKTNLPAVLDLYEKTQRDTRLWMLKNNIKTGRSRATATSSAGYQQGRAAGDSISLTPPVNGTSRARQLLG